MPGSILTQYGPSNTAISCSVASLGNNAAVSSDSIDNTSNNYQGAMIQVKVKTGGSSVAATGSVNVYAVGTANGGTNYSEGGGVNSVIALTSPPNAALITVINAVANSVTYVSKVVDVSAAFGGVLPEKWAIIVENKTGGPLDSTESNHTKFYEGVTTRYT